MEKKLILVLVIIVIVIVGAAVYLPSRGPESGIYDDFAACLAGKNITMYGAESCSWCQKEKSNFGDAFRYVPYVECPADPQKCIVAGIESTPTWIFPDGKKLVGYQGLEKLSQESGCPLRQSFSEASPLP